MDSHRGHDRGVALGKCGRTAAPFNRGAGRHHERDAGRGRPSNNLAAIHVELGRIQVQVSVNPHIWAVRRHGATICGRHGRKPVTGFYIEEGSPPVAGATPPAGRGAVRRTEAGGDASNGVTMRGDGGRRRSRNGGGKTATPGVA